MRHGAIFVRCVLIEAGYVGCPVISTRKFAIPEIIDDGRTGLLLDDSSPSSVASAMSWMLEHTSEYQEMRKAAWGKSRLQHSKTQFEARMCSYLNEVVSSDRKSGHMIHGTPCFSDALHLKGMIGSAWAEIGLDQTSGHADARLSGMAVAHLQTGQAR